MEFVFRVIGENSPANPLGIQIAESGILMEFLSALLSSPLSRLLYEEPFKAEAGCRVE